MYTIWVNYGREGWSPKDFKTKEEAIKFIQKGEMYGAEIRVTLNLKLDII